MQKLLIIGGAVGMIAGGLLLTASLTKLGEQPAQLTWRDPEIKSALMTFGYKVYGNPRVEFGRHYLSKLVFQNTGDHPVTDFSISYKIDDYIPWTDPEEYHAIPAGFTLVKLFYPKLPASVTKIRNATNATFRYRVRWNEEGHARDESFARDVVLRGVNEIAYCDLPESELRTQGTVSSWQDVFNASQFIVAMVTPNDPVVSLYAAEITRLAGGTVAGVTGGAPEIGRLCRITYDYMCATELRYTGDSGVPANFDNISSWVQTVRLPRDVIINNQGLCVELAVLWSSILEHLGLDTTIVFRPGHSYIIAYSEKQGLPLAKGLAIECTAITPRAVGRDTRVSFDEAVKMATEDVAKFTDDGRIKMISVKEYRGLGFTAPELADIDTDKLVETLRKRLPVRETQTEPLIGPAPGPLNETLGQAGVTTWQHPQGLVAVSFPSDFVSLMQPGNTPPFVLLSVGNLTTTVGCEVMHITGTQDPFQAVNNVASFYGQLGAMVQVTGSSLTANGATLINGVTTSSNANVRWICLARSVPTGVVLISVSAHANFWASQYPAIQSIVSNVRFN